jgi:large conductance mechanosensitive channel
MIRQMNKLTAGKPAEASPAEVITPEDVLLLREIRDSLKK